MEVEQEHQTFGNHIMDASQWVCTLNSEIYNAPYKTMFNHRHMLCTTLYRSFLQWATSIWHLEPMEHPIFCIYSTSNEKEVQTYQNATTIFCFKNFTSILNPLENQSANIYIHLGFATTPCRCSSSGFPLNKDWYDRLCHCHAFWRIKHASCNRRLDDLLSWGPVRIGGRPSVDRMPNCQLVGFVG